MHIVVIGAGVQGMCCAYFLIQTGFAVTVVDRAGAAGLECSFANGGGLLPSTGAPWNEPAGLKSVFKYLGRADAPLKFKLTALPSMIGFGLKFLSYANEEKFIDNTRLNTRLGFYSSEMMREIERGTGIDFNQADSGMTCFFRDGETQKSTEGFLDLMADDGVVYQSLTSGAVIKKEPSLAPIRDKITGGLFCPKERSADPYLFCRELTGFLQGKGVQFQFATNVTDIAREGETFKLISMDGRDINADGIVIAAGAYSPKIGKMLGVKIPVKPAKGYSLSIPLQGWNNPPRSVIADMGLHVGINPIGGKTLRVAGTAEFAGYDKKISQARADYLVRLVEAIFPEFAEMMNRDRLNPWAGLRPMSVDGVAILGNTPVPRLYVCTGQGHIGWTTAAGSGRLVADIIAGRKPELDIAGYALDRF